MRLGRLTWGGAVLLGAVGVAFFFVRPAARSGELRPGVRGRTGAVRGGAGVRSSARRGWRALRRPEARRGPADAAHGRSVGLGSRGAGHSAHARGGAALDLDAFEATAEAVAGHAVPDPLRAASGLTREEAAAYCGRQGGRLPTEDEWVVTAAGPSGHRYPWGETGAVCRRAAFGLAHGPCSFEGAGPDSVGAHVDGDSESGVHDLAGNVAEWVAPSADAPRRGVAKGGPGAPSWRRSFVSGRASSSTPTRTTSGSAFAAHMTRHDEARP